MSLTDNATETRMADEFRPLIEILRELKALALTQASGLFFVVTQDSHSCTIRLRTGQIEDVVYSRHRSDEAVQRLAKVPAARARFQADPSSVGTGTVSLSEASLRWLMGGFEVERKATRIGSDLPPRTAPPPSSKPFAAATAAQREMVESIALEYFGPIAGLLCEEAFGVPGSVDRALVQIAANLPVRDQENTFLAEVRGALGLL